MSRWTQSTPVCPQGSVRKVSALQLTVWKHVRTNMSQRVRESDGNDRCSHESTVTDTCQRVGDCNGGKCCTSFKHTVSNTCQWVGECYWSDPFAGIKRAVTNTDQRVGECDWGKTFAMESCIPDVQNPCRNHHVDHITWVSSYADDRSVFNNENRAKPFDVTTTHL